jgi:hypothetical protein
MRWALESGSLKLDPEYQYPIESMSDVLDRAKPQIAIKWFVMEQAGDEGEEEYEEVLVADPDEDWIPLELAERPDRPFGRLHVGNGGRLPGTLGMALKSVCF